MCPNSNLRTGAHSWQLTGVEILEDFTECRITCSSCNKISIVRVKSCNRSRNVLSEILADNNGKFNIPQDLFISAEELKEME